MEPKDGNGSGDQRPARKKRAPTARKRAPKEAQAAEQNGVNGVGTAERQAQVQTAYDVKEIHRSLSGFSDDDLKQIPILPEGTRLEQGATYIDLAEERPSEVKVNAGVIARAGHYYVPKNRVPYMLWNRLIGEAKPGQEASGAADRSVAEISTAGQAMGDRPAAGADTGGDGGYGNRDADRAAQVAADLKSWLDTRNEDRDAPREVL
ncbi:MAG: hypothetical protein ABR499_00720 [Gemmatimonadaceae bacterium]